MTDFAWLRIVLFYVTLQSLIYLDGNFVGLFSAETSFRFLIPFADLRSIPAYEAFTDPDSGAVWAPSGLTKALFLGGQPGVATAYAITAVAYASALAALFGLLTRWTAPVAVLSLVLLGQLVNGWGPNWARGYMVVNLVGLVLMWAPLAARSSLDATRGLRSVSGTANADWWRRAAMLTLQLFLLAVLSAKTWSDLIRPPATGGAFDLGNPIGAVLACGLAAVLSGTAVLTTVMPVASSARSIAGICAVVFVFVVLGSLFDAWYVNWLPFAAIYCGPQEARRLWGMAPAGVRDYVEAQTQAIALDLVRRIAALDEWITSVRQMTPREIAATVRLSIRNAPSAASARFWRMLPAGARDYLVRSARRIVSSHNTLARGIVSLGKRIASLREMTARDMATAVSSSMRSTAFAPGASLSIAVCRIALFYASLQSLIYLDGQFVGLLSADTGLGLFVWTSDLRSTFYYDTWLANVSPSTWLPKGLVKLFFPSAAPSPATMYAITGFAYASTVAALLGLFTRITAPLSVLSVLLVSSIFASWGAYWSHGFNVVHLAGLAFMFGRSGDRLSLDAWIAKWRGRDPRLGGEDEGDYRWPVVAGELAVHMFLFAAFWSKFTNGGGLWWALSDNLRNSLAVTWGLYRSHPPAIVDLVLAHIWVFRLVGIAQLGMQLITIISCLLIRHPVWRLLIGGLFMLLEIMGLGVLFEFWHMNWLPLLAFSVDWDRLVARLRSGARSAVQVPPVVWRIPATIASPWALRIYFSLFFGYYAANFLFQLGEKHLNYPFSSMAFFSFNRALAPYSVHQPWYESRGVVRIFERDRLEPVELSHIPSAIGELWRADTARGRMNAVDSVVAFMDSGYGWCQSVDEMQHRGTWQKLDGRLRGAAFERVCQRAFVSKDLARVELYRAIAAVPAYPAYPLPLRDVHMGLVAVYVNGSRAALGATVHVDPATMRWYLEIESEGLDIQEMEVKFRADIAKERDLDEIGDPQPLDGEWVGNAFIVADSEYGYRYMYPLIRVVDAKLGELVFAGPDFPAVEPDAYTIGLYGKPLAR